MENDFVKKDKLSFDTLTSVMNSIGTAWIFVLLLLVNADIIGRACFNSPIRGVPEIVALSIVACVFLQLAHTIKVGRLTRSDMLLNFLAKKAPNLKSFLDGLYHLVGAGLMSIILISSWPFFIQAWEIDEYVGAEGDFMAPVWPVKFIIVFGCAITALQFLILAWRHFKEIELSSLTSQDMENDCD